MNRSIASVTPATDCGACENSGYVSVVRQEVEKGVWRICEKSRPFPVQSEKELASFAFPCFCRHSPHRLSEIDAMTVRANHFGAPGASRQDMQDYIDECRRLWDEQERQDVGYEQEGAL